MPGKNKRDTGPGAAPNAGPDHPTPHTEESGPARDSGADRDAMAALLQRQRTGFNLEPFPSARQRKADLQRLGRKTVEYQQALTEAMSQDFGGRAPQESIIGDILPSVMALRHNARRVRRWMRPEPRSVHPLYWPARAEVVYQPLGVVGVVVPWNYPVFLALGPLASILAAGNRAMIKVSEHAPETGKVLKMLLADCFPDSRVAVIQGDADVARAFTGLPFDHLLFTGSTAVGRRVMQAAADNLTPVTLELGGKSPVIIDDSMNMDTAVERFLWSKTLNAGQTCVAADYVLCPGHRVEELVQSCRRVHRRLYPDELHNPDYASIINQPQFIRLHQWLAQARHAGARVETPGGPDLQPDPYRRRFPLTLVIDPPRDTPMAQQEIFGPILPVLTYQGLDDAAAHIRAGTRPLALYVMSHKAGVQDFFIRNTHAGGMAINDAALQVVQDDLPFGGVGHSGMGHYHGREGFITFSNAKSVFRRGRLSFNKLIFPPYGRWGHRLLSWLYLR